MSCEDLKELYKETYVALVWSNAIVSVLLQHHGGSVEISRELLASIDISKVRIEARYDEEKDTYIVEGDFNSE